jgi:hypothetical protein
LFDHRWPKVAVARTRNLEIKRSGTRFKTSRSADVTEVAASVRAFMRLCADVLVKLGPDRRIVDQGKYLLESVLIFQSEQLGESRALLERQIGNHHWILSFALHRRRDWIAGVEAPHPTSDSLLHTFLGTTIGLKSEPGITVDFRR